MSIKFSGEVAVCFPSSLLSPQQMSNDHIPHLWSILHVGKYMFHTLPLEICSE